MSAGEDTEPARTRQGAGIRTFAGVLMLLIGGYHAMAGIAALPAVLRDRLWGRLVGIVLAGLSLFANFLFLLYYPLWAALIIALDVVIIWALTAYRPEPA